ncbi:MAG: hypothetical protein KAS67_01485 [Thermoplasmata archaeon]|nr:hypothetical protein [Thermoplasmata archaeon]
MKRMSLKSKKQMLKLHPPICPICNEEAVPGFFGGLYPKWVSKERKRPFIDLLLSSIGENNPAYICKRCNLVFGMTRRMDRSKHDESKDSIIDGQLSNCTYCSSRLEPGFVYGTRGLIWCKNYIRGRGRGVILLVPLLGIRQKDMALATKRCMNCGMFYSRYHPDKVRKGNIIGLAFIVAFVALFLFLVELLIYFF